MAILLTGGSGLLGKHLRALREFTAPSHAALDIETFDAAAGCPYDAVVHAAAFTDVLAADTVPEQAAQCYRTNVLGTRRLARWARSTAFVFISTEYVFDGERGHYREEDPPSPINFYAMTKAAGEREVMRAVPHHLIIRTLFKPRPFEWPEACVDMWTSGDYVDRIAVEIDRAVEAFLRGAVSGVLHVGTGRKSIFDLARESREVRPIRRQDLKVVLPRDTSLDLSRWREIRDRR